MAYVPNSGSVVAFQSDPAQLQASVTGTVTIRNVPSIYGNISGSVVSFQGTTPWVNVNVGSVISVNQGSVATVIVGGSIAASFTPPANQSVSGTVQTDVRGSVATVIIGGSIAASFTPPANQSVSGTVHVDNFSSVVTFQQAGSILAVSGSFSPPANQSVSGTVGASLIGLSPVNVTNFPTSQNVSGSVVAFPGINPWPTTQVGSAIGLVQGSIATVIIGGSIAASFTPPANQSVSGTVDIGVSPGSVVAFQGTTNWTVKSSIAGGIFPISGSVAAVVTNTNINVSGSVVAFLGNSTNASVITVGTAAPNQSVSGTVNTLPLGTIVTSLVSTVPSSVLVGASIFGQLPTGTAMLGSIAAFQGAVPWINTNVGSIITVGQGSIAVNIIAGSIAASFTPPANQSVSGTVDIGTSSGSVVAFQGTANWTVKSSIAGGIFPVSGSVAAVVTNFPTSQNVSGSVVSFQGTNPWTVVSSISGGIFPISGSVAAVITGTPNVNTAGSVVAFQGTSPWTVITQPSIAVNIIAGSVAVSVTPPANQSVSGTVDVSQIGAWRVSVVSATPSSMLVGASIIGLPPVNVTNQVTVVSSITGGIFPISGSVAAVVTNTNVNVSGSVVSFQGTSPWVTNFQNSSILAVPVGSVISYLQAPSIVGTYVEDAAAATGDKGLFILGVRNDTMSSVTSADLDYSQMAVGPTGENIVANAPITKWIRGTADLRVVLGSSVTAIAAQGASIFTYITGIQLANMGPSSVLVTFGGGLGSILGYSIAPAGGGSNILYPNALKTGENSAFTASISGTASVLVSAQGFISKT